MARYLVTGGCGFIGSHLVDSLVADGHDVIVLDNLSTGRIENVAAGAEIVIGDIEDATLVSRCLTDTDGCFHLAAVASVQQSVESWLETHRSNLTGTIAVLNAARGRDDKASLPIILASSAAVYGACEEIPLRETANTVPLTPYGADKLGCELHGRVAAHMFGVPVTALRFFNVYGPRQNPNSPYSGVISIFCSRILMNQPIVIHGDGLQCRDFVYVADVVRFMRRAMLQCRRAEFNVFNVCTGRRVTLLDLVDVLGELCANSVKIQHDRPRVGDIRESVGDPNNAAAVLDLVARTSLHDGLQSLLHYLDR